MQRQSSIRMLAVGFVIVGVIHAVTWIRRILASAGLREALWTLV